MTMKSTPMNTTTVTIENVIHLSAGFDPAGSLSLEYEACAREQLLVHADRFPLRAEIHDPDASWRLSATLEGGTDWGRDNSQQLCYWDAPPNEGGLPIDVDVTATAAEQTKSKKIKLDIKPIDQLPIELELQAPEPDVVIENRVRLSARVGSGGLELLLGEALIEGLAVQTDWPPVLLEIAAPEGWQLAVEDGRPEQAWVEVNNHRLRGCVSEWGPASTVAVTVTATDASGKALAASVEVSVIPT